MVREFSSRVLLAVGAVMVISTATLGILQYRWSERVAAADAQREKEHLESAATLFAKEFDTIARQAITFLNNTGRTDLREGQPIRALPELIGELYSMEGQGRIRRLNGEGRFEPVPTPEWGMEPRCGEVWIDQPPSLVVDIYAIASSEKVDLAGRRITQMLQVRSDRCFVARLDEKYLRQTLFPRLIRQSFGETAVREYDFGVTSANPGKFLYGSVTRAEVRKPFLSLAFAETEKRGAIVVQRFGGDAKSIPAALLGKDLWELQISRKGEPLAAVFRREQQRELLLSLGVELLLVAAMVFLAAGARRMQRLAEQKMRFVAGVSHELRTPVASIGLLARNQADGLVTDAGKIRQYGELIHQQSSRLSELIEQALMFAGIQSGRRPAPRAVNLGELITEALDARREELVRAGFTVELALSPSLPGVPGDPRMLRIAVDNLLSNAAKHAAGGHWIRVSAESSGREVHIRVEDRGPGIEADEQASLFEPFCRGRAAEDAQIPGSGLGLSLVRGTAEAHGGRVTLDSAPGRGSAFTIHLPL
jgi:signal transduction histidine kinase